MKPEIVEMFDKAEHAIIMRNNKEYMGTEEYLYLIGFVAGSIGSKKFAKIMEDILEKQAEVMTEELLEDLL
jgi:hypothetical protein